MVDNYNANRISGVYLMIALIIVSIPSLVFAKATNVNEVNSLFEDHIENKDEYFKHFKNLRDESTGRIESKSGLSSIKDVDKADSFSNQINSIDPYDLGEEGRKVRASEEYKFYDEKKLAPDWSKEGNIMHMQDAEDITLAAAEKFKSLKTELEKLGLDFDCSNQKKPTQIDPSFSLEIKRNPEENVAFDQILCEELRNKYDCRDQLDLTCKRFGIRWTHWEDKAMLLDGVWIYHAHMGWFYPLQWTSDRYGLHLREGHPAVQAEMRLHIAATEGVNIENIDEHIIYGARGEGNTVHADKDMYAFQVYRVHYKIRRGEEICEEWEEDWDERCNLK